MTEQTDKMNYCCDCGWAVKKGLFFKKWYCTCPEILKKNLDTVLCIVDTKRTECRKLREDMFGDHFEFLPCLNYKGELRYHPAIPPMKCPLPCPPLPERVEKATQEHDAAYLMNQKQKGLEAENQQLKEAESELLKKLNDAIWSYSRCNYWCSTQIGENCDCNNTLSSMLEIIQKYDGKDGVK